MWVYRYEKLENEEDSEVIAMKKEVDIIHKSYCEGGGRC
jgi:hypothetical protein